VQGGHVEGDAPVALAPVGAGHEGFRCIA
jgi:hypothetical protein